VIRAADSSSDLIELVAALGRAKGVDLVEHPLDEIDLVITETAEPSAVRVIASHGRAPLLVLADRRLRPHERQALLDAGANRVVDSDSSVLDLGFAISELLFDTFVEQRRYHKSFGGLTVRFSIPNDRDQGATQGTSEARPRSERSERSSVQAGRLLGIARKGSFIQATERPPEGTPVDLEIDLAGIPVSIRGRVAYAQEDGFAVEYALDQEDVAPRLQEVAREQAEVATRDRTARSG
jgi:hypothetical protein